MPLVASSATTRSIGHVATRIYVAERDPSLLLVLESWTDRALRSRQPSVRERVRPLAQATVGVSAPRWLRAWRWIEHVGRRSSVFVAVVERVAPADEVAHLDWLRDIQDEVQRQRLAFGQMVLRDESDPGLIVVLTEHASPADRTAVLALVAANPSPVPTLERTTFVGHPSLG